MNLLVGATGFVGGHVVEYLLEQGEISKGVFRRGAHLKILDASGVQSVEADLLNRHELGEAMEGVDTIYSMASPMPYGDEDFARVNSVGTRNLLQAAAEARVKTLVHLSTLDVYGFGSRVVTSASKVKPSGPYQESKLEADGLVQEFAETSKDTRAVIVRPARALGSRDTTLAGPLLRLMETGMLVLPRSSVAMSFTHPRDIAQAMFRATRAPVRSGKIILVKSFDATPDELVSSLSSSLSLAPRRRNEGVFFKSRLPRYTSEQLRAGLRIEAQTDWGELGYSPMYDLRKTCEDIVEWYRKEPWMVEEA